MLEKAKTVLLLSDIEVFVNQYKELAYEADTELRVEDNWSLKYRVKEEVIITGAKYLDKINSYYYPLVVLILKKDESPYPYIKQGITRFIFDFQNKYELMLAFYKYKSVVLHASSSKLSVILEDSEIRSFCFGNYNFQFDRNIFKYKGNIIYLTESNKRYLAEWLLNGHKDNKKRMVLFNLRKKLGNDFLSDVDRYGQYKGGC